MGVRTRGVSSAAPTNVEELFKGEIAIENSEWLKLMQSCQEKKESKKSDAKSQEKTQGPPPEAQRRILTRSKGSLNN